MKIRRGHVGALLCAAALGVAAGCGGGGSGSGGGETGAGGDTTEAPDTGSGGGGGTNGDGGLSIDEVKTLILEGDLNVRGWVVDVGGTTYLCSSGPSTPSARSVRHTSRCTSSTWGLVSTARSSSPSASSGRPSTRSWRASPSRARQSRGS